MLSLFAVFLDAYIAAAWTAAVHGEGRMIKNPLLEAKMKLSDKRMKLKRMNMDWWGKWAGFVALGFVLLVSSVIWIVRS